MRIPGVHVVWVTSTHENVVEAKTLPKEDQFIEVTEGGNRYKILSTQSITETRLFGYQICHNCDEGVDDDSIMYEGHKFCSFKCFKNWFRKLI